MWTTTRRACSAAVTTITRRCVHNSTGAAVPLRSFDVADHAKPSWSLQDYSSDRGATSSIASISSAELTHLSSLSYLAAPSASGRLAADVDAVVGWVASISHLDVDRVQPMYTPLEIKEYYTAIENKETTSATSTSDSTAAVPEVADLSCGDSAEALRLRPDFVTDGGIEKQIIGNAAFKHRGFFVVPKVVDLEDS